MTRYRLYAFDLDGTLYRGEDVVEGTPAVLAALREQGAQIRFLTNNSGRTREDFVKKLTHMGFDAAPEDVVSSATGTAAYCQERGYRHLYVVGEPGLVATLRDAGMTVVNAHANGLTVPQVGVSMAVDAVVVGICRHFDYPMMESAMRHITSGADFIATNRDATYPLEGGRFQPGAGSVVAGIATASGKEPFVVGKPNPFLVETILKESGLTPDQVLVVGDRIDTDIDCGRRAGCDTYLVLTGVETEVPAGQWGGKSLDGLLA